MLTTVQGVYRDGKIELLEPAPDLPGAQVLVTFVPAGNRITLADLGITRDQAAEIRTRFGGIAEDWDSPEMDEYDEL